MSDGLIEGTIINRKYSVQKVISEDDYSISYLCEDSDYKKVKIIEVFIKSRFKRSEDLMKVEYESRYNKSLLFKIKEEIDSLCYFELYGVEKFIEAFFYNNTLYFVYSYSEGESLKKYLEKNKRDKQLCNKMKNKLKNIIINMHSSGVAHRGISDRSVKVINGKEVIVDYCDIPLYISDIVKRISIRKKYHKQDDLKSIIELIGEKDTELLNAKNVLCYNTKGNYKEQKECDNYNKLAITGIGGRHQNEDRYICYCDGKKQILIVADGAGGCGNGDVAASMAVDYIRGYFLERQITYGSIKKCFNEVNDRIHAKNSSMKTTVVCLLIQDDICFSVHLGDSRLYQVRNKRLIYKTEDHSYVAQLVRDGRLTEQEALCHGDRNIIYKALGDEYPVEPEIKQLNYQKGDCFLLATDGFWENITDKDVEKNITKENWLSDMDIKIKSDGNVNQDNYTALIWR